MTILTDWGGSPYDLNGGGYMNGWTSGLTSGGGYIIGPGFTSTGGTTGGTTGSLPSWFPNITLNLNGSSLSPGTRAAAQSDPQATAVAILNQAEQELQRNLSDYMQGERTLSRQQAALQRFDDIFAQVKTLLSDPRLGTWGANGLRDRLPGGQYDWTAYYRTPIAQDKPTVDILGIGPKLERTVSSLSGPTIMLVGLAAVVVIILLARR